VIVIKKRALITGFTGQDGSYLAEFLLNKGYHVIAIIRRNSTPNLPRVEHVKHQVEMHEADLGDTSSLIRVLAKTKPQEIYHLGAMSWVHGSFHVPTATGDITGLGTSRLLEAIRILNMEKEVKFYNASSSEMFGLVKETPQNENTPFYPRSPYGIAKVYAFQTTRMFREAYGLFACNGVLFNHECVSENTPLIIRNNHTKKISIKRIKDIKKALEKGKGIQQWRINNVEIWDGDAFVSLQCITATKRKEKDNNFVCKIINSRHGVIEVTNHHNMLDERKEKIKAEQIKIGTKLLHKDFPKYEGECCITKEEAMFIGMMVGDGYINEDGSANFSNNNKEVMNDLEKLWFKIGLGTIKIEEQRKTEYGKSTNARLNGNTAYLRYLHSQIYTRDGFKKIPESILNTNNEIRKAFLKGYNRTDGLKSNRSTYEFKNFKTNSILLAQGLLFLVQQVTKQEFNITFDEDKEYYGYYSINLLSPINQKEKEEKIQELVTTGLGQRAINRTTNISRTLIRKIQRGGHAVTNHHLTKIKEEVKKVLYHNKQPTWVYDVETASGKFMGGLGTIVIANSPRRGKEFVTRKITHTAVEIALGTKEYLELGNLNAKRDFGYAPEFIEAMWLILQQETPDDYVVATGESHTVREFAEKAFALLDMPIRWEGTEDEEVGINTKTGKVVIRVNRELQRPAEVYALCGDSSKARKKLGWEPKTRFDEIVKIMVEADYERLKKTDGKIIHHY